MDLHRLAKGRQAFRSIWINELFVGKPASVEAVPKLNRVQLNGKLINAPRPVSLNALTCPVKRDAIHSANRADDSPMGANEAIFKCDIIGT